MRRELKELSNITLLSKKDAEELPKEFLSAGEWYWLLPDKDSNNIAIVTNDGVITFVRQPVLGSYGGLRIICDCDELFNLGECFTCDDEEFFVYKTGKAISKRVITCIPYSSDYNLDYEKSDAKKYIDSVLIPRFDKPVLKLDSRDWVINILHNHPGVKVSHRYFAEEEYLVSNKDDIVFSEEGYVFEDWESPFLNGMRMRYEKAWQTGWKLYIPPKKKIKRIQFSGYVIGDDVSIDNVKKALKGLNGVLHDFNIVESEESVCADIRSYKSCNDVIKNHFLSF